MNNYDFDWTKFKKKILIKTTVDQAFKHWVIPKYITQWFIAKARYITPANTIRHQSEFIQAGDRYYWKWHQDLEIEGEIINLIENQILQFTFGKNEEDPPKDIIVTVNFQEIKDETLLELTQENMSNTPHSNVSWYMSCNLGWTFFITNLKAWLEHSVDLRETDTESAEFTRALTND